MSHDTHTKMLKEVFLVFAVFALANAAPRRSAPRLNGRIIGGSEVDIGDFPYQASMLYFNTLLCGAVNIAPFFMLTAGHCVEGMTSYVTSVHVGSSHYAFGGLDVAVEQFYLHPQYDPRTIDYDMAIMKLAVGLGSGAGVSSIALPRQNQEFPAGTVATVSGWGSEVEWGTYFDKLRAVDIPIIDTEICREAYVDDENITARMLCAGEGDYGGCQGDDGGPLVIEGPLLVGIFSWVLRCGSSNYPSIFTNVAALRDFIKEIANV